MNHQLLTKFKQKARIVEPLKSGILDFPFTNLQLQTLDTKEKQDKFLNSILLTAEAMANKIFQNVDEELILFFAAYLFVYQNPRSNFRKPDFFEISSLQSEFTDHENENIAFGLYETSVNVQSSAAYYFCRPFAMELNTTAYHLKKSDFQVEDLLAKIGAPFLIDEVENCKKFCVFDGRRPANEARLFLFDVNAGHIEALKIKNPIGTSYEYDENLLAYGRVRGTFLSEFKKIKGSVIHLSRMTTPAEGESANVFYTHIDTNDIDTDSDHILDKLAACEKFCFI